MELKPFYHEAQIALSEDFTLHMVMNIASIDRIERLFGESIQDVFVSMLQSVAVMAKVLWGLTREHHEELSLNQITAILLPADAKLKPKAEAVAATLGDLMKRALLVNGEVALG